MDYRELVKSLTSSRVVTPSLVHLPSHAANPADLAEVRRRLGRHLDPGLVEFYTLWDGADLDVLRVSAVNELRTDEFGLIFGSDPSGFVYRFDHSGRVAQQDTDGGGIEIVAADFRDFIFGLVFGPRAAEFAGDQWLRDLRDAGITT